MRKIAVLILLAMLGSQAALAEDESVAQKAGKGVKKAGEATGSAIEKGVDATGRGLKKGAAATGRGLENAGKWLQKKTHTGDKSDDKK